MASYTIRVRLQRFYKIEAESIEEAREKVKEQFDKDKELNEQTMKDASQMISEDSENSN